jgi:hypothetical protein
MKEIESLYESVLNEKYKHEAKYHDKEDIVPLVKDTGPEAADNVNLKMVDTEALSDKEEKDNVYKPAKFSQKSGKVKKESINNSVMENENIFDRLYKTVMEGDEFDHFDDDGPEVGDDLDTGDDFGEEEEPSVTVQLSPTHVEALLDLLAQVEDQVGEEEDEGEDIEDFEDDEEDALVAESLITESLKAKAKKILKTAGLLAAGVVTYNVLRKHPDVVAQLGKAAKDLGKDAKEGLKAAITVGKELGGAAKEVGGHAFPRKEAPAAPTGKGKGKRGGKARGEAVESEEVDYDESLLNPKGNNKVGNVKPKGGKASSGNVKPGTGKSGPAPDGVAKHAGNKGSQKVTDLTWG